MNSRNLLWGGYAVFALAALYWDGTAKALSLATPYGAAKPVIWLMLIAFLAYSAYSTFRESLPRTIGVLLRLYWGRQIGADLYIGLLLFAGLIFLVHGSALGAILWLAAILVFGNLATLLYLALHFDAVVAKLIA